MHVALQIRTENLRPHVLGRLYLLANAALRHYLHPVTGTHLVRNRPEPSCAVGYCFRRVFCQRYRFHPDEPSRRRAAHWRASILLLARSCGLPAACRGADAAFWIEAGPANDPRWRFSSVHRWRDFLPTTGRSGCEGEHVPVLSQGPDAFRSLTTAPGLRSGPGSPGFAGPAPRPGHRSSCPRTRLPRRRAPLRRHRPQPWPPSVTRPVPSG